MFYSSQGWPALGEQTVDLLVMSYVSGTISVLGGVLGAFGIYAAFKVKTLEIRTDEASQPSSPPLLLSPLLPFLFETRLAALFFSAEAIILGSPGSNLAGGVISPLFFACLPLLNLSPSPFLRNQLQKSSCLQECGGL